MSISKSVWRILLCQQSLIVVIWRPYLYSHAPEAAACESAVDLGVPDHIGALKYCNFFP